MDILTGESIKNELQYRKEIDEARKRREAAQSAKELNNNNNNNNNRPRPPPAPQGNGGQYRNTPERNQRRNPFGITGEVYVGDRCGKCGRVGHRQATCSRPHPRYDETKPMQLLEMMSHDKNLLPN
jgi:hypothetical protein